MGLETALTVGHTTRKILENPTVTADTLPRGEGTSGGAHACSAGSGGVTPMPSVARPARSAERGTAAAEATAAEPQPCSDPHRGLNITFNAQLLPTPEGQAARAQERGVLAEMKGGGEENQ